MHFERKHTRFVEAIPKRVRNSVESKSYNLMRFGFEVEQSFFIVAEK